MLKKILLAAAMLYAAMSFAAVDVNKATAAELDSIKGIGPAMSTKILDERKKSSFKDWNDFIGRVKGVGKNSATKLSTEGLTVNGDEFKSDKAGKKDDKKMAAKPSAEITPVATPAPVAPAATAKAADTKIMAASAPKK